MREAFAELGVILLNVGTSYTLRGRGLGSIVDVIFVTAALVRRVALQVSKDYNHSDYGVI